MSRGVNKVIIVGNLCADPETRYSQSGSAITNCSIATNESWTDKQSGQKQERAEFHRVVLFNRLAEISGEYLRKGSQVYIEGSLRTRKWQDQQGQDRYTTEVVASEMQMLGGKQDGQGQQGGYAQQQGGYQAPQQNYQQPQQHAPQNYQQPQRQPHQQSNSAPNRSQPAPSMDSFDDD